MIFSLLVWLIMCFPVAIFTNILTKFVFKSMTSPEKFILVVVVAGILTVLARTEEIKR